MNIEQPAFIKYEYSNDQDHVTGNNLAIPNLLHIYNILFIEYRIIACANCAIDKYLGHIYI